MLRSHDAREKADQRSLIVTRMTLVERGIIDEDDLDDLLHKASQPVGRRPRAACEPVPSLSISPPSPAHLFRGPRRAFRPANVK